MHLPLGFRFAGAARRHQESTRRRKTSRSIHCPGGATAAGVYTQNLVFAAPVALDRQRTPSADIRVVAVNSGNANACTGERGLRDAREMARLAAAAVGAAENQALVMSTGVIGVFLPMDKIAAGATAAAAARLATDEAAFLSAARGILTTDKGIKIASRSLTSDGREVRAGRHVQRGRNDRPEHGDDAGRGDDRRRADAGRGPAALAAAVEDSFNCISVEGHMSTNDTVLLLASGSAGQGAAGQRFRVQGSGFRKHSPLTTHWLQPGTVPDGSKRAVHRAGPADSGRRRRGFAPDHDRRAGRRTRDDARRIAQTIANSALVKTAVSGADPNWGRIVSAAGYAGVPLDPASIGLVLNGHRLYADGAPVPFDARTVSAAIKASRETSIVLTLREGPASIRFWTSDLNVEYVRFNADYTT